jgi:DNA-directed RNA polymerase specialized sigma24 family protein
LVFSHVIEPQTSAHSNAAFPTTHWSRVIVAGNSSSPEAREALAELCAAYWYPLYAFVRHRGHDPATAEDLVQGFFAALLESDGLASVDRAKGRFRTFLISACTHFLANRRDFDQTQKRGGGRVIVPLTRLDAEDRYCLEPAHELTAERLFMRRWVTTLLDHVLKRLEAEMSAAGKGRLFEALRPALAGTSEKVSHARTAAKLGCSEAAARAAVHRLRARYRALLREEVARTLDDPSTVDEEIRDLFAAFAD